MIVNIKAKLIQGEGEQLDFKNKISSEIKIARTLVAFANNKGGQLLIGITDDGQIKGIKNEDEERYMLERAANLYCKPVIDVKFDEVAIDNKLVLIATIAESDIKPHYALDEDQKWWVYIRVKDKSMLAGKVVIDVLKRSTSEEGILITYSEKERSLLTYLEENRQANLIDLCKHLHLSRRKTQRLLVNLILAGLIKVDIRREAEYYIPVAI